MKFSRQSRFFILGWSCLCWCLLPGFALDPEKKISQYRQTHWTVAEGLPQSTVFAGVKDQSGFLWLGTQEGLARFDGKTFQVFDRTNTPAFRSHSILALFCDDQARIWIGTERGLYVYANGGIQAAPGSDAFQDIWVWCMSVDHSGRMLVGTEEKGLLIFENNQLVPAPKAWGFQRGAVYSVVPDKDGDTLWIGDARGLFKLQSDQATMLSEAEGYAYGPAFELLMSRNGDLWICVDDGLVRYRDGKARLFTEADGLDSNFIYAIFEDRDENLWVGTASGLNRIRGDRIEVESAQTKGVFNPINVIWEDGENNLWVGRSNDGLFNFCDVSMTTFTQEEGLVHDFVWAVTEDAQGRIVFGTDHGLSRYDGSTFESITTANGLKNDRIHSLANGPDGSLWIGTTKGIITRLDEHSSRHFELGMGGLSRNSIAAMCFDENGRLWVGADSGLFILEDGVFKQPKGPLVNEPVVHISRDSSAKIWVSAPNRVGYYQNSDPNTFRELSLPKAAEILCFYRDSRGNTWLGTFGHGLWRFDGANMVMMTKAQGLFDNTVYSILEDDGFFWMSSNRGISKVAIEDLGAVASGRSRTLRYAHFGVSDGMKSVECNGGTWPVGYKTRDGYFWFATTWGAVRVNPDSSQAKAHYPEVQLLDFQVDGEPMLREQVNQISGEAKQIVISYTAPSFRQTDLLRFRYRLKGFSKQWQEVEKRRVAYFNHLPKGRYQFEVMATIGQNPWPRQGKTIQFEVTQPWLKHPMLLPAMAFLLFGLILLFLLSRLRKERSKAHGLLSQVQQTEQKVKRLEGTWSHMQAEYLDTIVEAGVGEMAGKVLQAVNQGLEDIQHHILKVENTLRGSNLDQRLRKIIPAMTQNAGIRSESKPGDDVVTGIATFSETLKTLRGNMLEEVVEVCDEIHRIGEMVEVQQDYAIIDQKIDSVNLNALLSDVLRMQSPYLKSSKLQFKLHWQELPPVRAHTLKLFLTLCGIVRQVARATLAPKIQRLGYMHLSHQAGVVELVIWAPDGEILRTPDNSISKLTFLQEIQWLLGEKAEGELTFLKEKHRQGYRMRLSQGDTYRP